TILTEIASVCRSQNAEELPLLFAAWAVRLRGVMPELEGIADTGPGFRSPGRHEPICAARRRAVGYAFEDLQVAGFASAYLARCSVDNWSRAVCHIGKAG